MPDQYRETDREILIEVRGLVAQLVDTSRDHEARIRMTERDVADMRTSKREQDAATRRLLGWGMLLAAIGGALGHILMQTVKI